MQKQIYTKRDVKLSIITIVIELKHGSFVALKTLLINRSLQHNLATCALGDILSTSSDTLQILEILETSPNLDTPLF